MHEVAEEVPTKKIKVSSGVNESKFDIPQGVSDLYRDGIVAQKGAFSREWAEQMKEDMMESFWAAIQRPKGAIARGPRRWYVEINPEEFGGFVDLVTHPWVVGMCESVLGKDYRIVELGFDVPFQGAKGQPWHRDFPSPPASYESKQIKSMAFNLTGTDVTKDMGALEIAHGTHWEDGRAWKDQMFPPQSESERYKSLAVFKYPQLGDISCRSALTIHRGTAHPSPIPRPVLVLGVDSNNAEHSALHAPVVTKAFWSTLPESVKEHLVCRQVDVLSPVVQKHEIQGLEAACEH